MSEKKEGRKGEQGKKKRKIRRNSIDSLPFVYYTCVIGLYPDIRATILYSGVGKRKK